MPESPALARRLSFGLVTFYGLGTTLGAGIFVLLGAVAGAAGPWTPLAFLLAAAIAAVTAMSYAELVRRLPVCAGEAMYVDAAFGRPLLTRAVGLTVAAIGIVSAATIVNGCAAYTEFFVPLPKDLAITLMVLTLTAVAIVGITVSAWVASLMTVAGIAGLVLVIAFAGRAMEGAGVLAALTPPTELKLLGGIAAGAFLAFFAFLGFEDMVNVAEEVHDARRTLPRAILAALGIATLLYVLVALTAMAAVPLDQLAGSEAPLAILIAPYGVDVRIIAGISFLAVINGALVQTIKSARVLYGLARASHLPALLAHIAPRTHTPAVATVVVSLLVLALATNLELVALARVASFVTLLLFATVNFALLVLRRREARAAGLSRAHSGLPLSGMTLSLALIAAELVTVVARMD